MDRLELEVLAEQMVDRVQFDGYAVAHNVTDPPFLRQLLRSQARQRSLRIRTGVSSHPGETVWACRQDGDFDFARPGAEADEQAVRDALDDLFGPSASCA